MLDQPLPKYRIVTSALEREIRNGTLEPGRRIPGEHELARRFNVSRGTVRQALGILTRHRLIRTHPGAGSYVEFEQERLEYRLGWSAAMARQGVPTTIRVLRLTVVELHDLASRLGADGAQFVALDRVRSVGMDGLVSFERSRLPLTKQTETLLEVDFTRVSLTSALRRIGEVAATSEEWIQVHRLESEESERLRHPAGDVCLLVRRVTRGRGGRLIEHAESFLDPERFHLHFGPTTLERASLEPGMNWADRE